MKDSNGNTVYEDTPWFKDKYPDANDRNRIKNEILTEQGAKMPPVKKEKARTVEKITFLVIIVFLCETCVSTKSIKSSSKFYSTRNFKSVDNSSYLSLNFFHYSEKKKPIPAFYYINGIIFGPKENFKFDVIKVQPGTYHIVAGYVGKKLTQAKVNVEKKDSVIVRMYLKYSSKPLK